MNKMLLLLNEHGDPSFLFRNLSSYNIVTRAGDDNFQSRIPTANGLITRLSTFSLLVHGKSTNVSPLFTLYYEYIAHPVLAI